MTRFLNMVLVGSIVFYGVPASADVQVLDREDAGVYEGSDLDSPWRFAASEIHFNPNLYAAAETDTQADIDSQTELDNRIGDLEYERDRISTAGPRGTAIAGGVVLVVGGVAAAAAALACSQANSNPGTRCRKDRARDIQTVGGIAAGLGLVALIGGLFTLGSRKQRRREFDRQILELEEQRTVMPENLEARISLGQTKMLTLSWSF